MLSGDEVHALDGALLAAYRRHEELCLAHPIARGKISRPGIPAAFSESVAALVLPTLVDRITAIEFGGRAADLIVATADGGQLTIEVKASGVSRWQELKQRDLEADALIWIDFGRRYVDGDGPITAYYLPRPSRYNPPRRKLTLDVFLSGASGIGGFARRTYAKLDDVIVPASD